MNKGEARNLRLVVKSQDDRELENILKLAITSNDTDVRSERVSTIWSTEISADGSIGERRGDLEISEFTIRKRGYYNPTIVKIAVHDGGELVDVYVSKDEFSYSNEKLTYEKCQIPVESKNVVELLFDLDSINKSKEAALLIKTIRDMV